MEVLGIIGLIVLFILFFVGGGLLGWIFKGLGAIFNFLMEGWWSCLGTIIIIFFILVFLAALA